MVAAVDAQQYAAMRPYVQVSTSVRLGTQFIYLEIENVGKTAASELTLSLDKNFYQLGRRDEQANLRNLPAFSKPIKNFGPGFKLRFLLGNAPSIFGGSSEHCPGSFEVTAAYSTARERVFDSTQIELDPYLWTDVENDPIAEQLEKVVAQLSELENLRKSVDHLRTARITPHTR